MMTPEEFSQFQEYQKLRNQSGEDLVGRILFDLSKKADTGNAVLGGIIKWLKGEAVQEESREKQEQADRKAAQAVLEGIKKTIDGKDVDLSQVLAGLASVATEIKNGNKEAKVLLASIEAKEHTDITKELSAIKDVLSQEKSPEEPIDFSAVIDSQKKGFSDVVKVLSELALASQQKEKQEQESVKIDGEVNLAKPSWWKDFSFSWDPLEKLLSPIKALLEKIASKEGEKLPMKNGRVLVEVDRVGSGGGMGNPFQFDESGNLKTTGGSSTTIDAVGVKDSSDARINPATKEGIASVVTAIQNITVPAPPAPVGGATASKQDDQMTLELKDNDEVQEQFDKFKREESGELNTIDENIRMVLGTERLVTNGKLNVNAIPEYSTAKKILPLVTNSVQMIDVTGMSSLAIQVLGTWTGTLTFECSLDGGTWVSMYGIAVNGTALTTTTTANGIYRFNVAGLTKVQVRFSTATTGAPILYFIASPEPSSIIVNPISGSQANPLNQRATTFELNTYDTNLATATTPQATPAIIAPVAPTLPAAYVSNFFSKFPQIFARLKVESAGDKKVPFAQADNTWKLKTEDDEIRVLLQDILVQLKVSNSFKYQQLDFNGMPNLKIPEGFIEQSNS